MISILMDALDLSSDQTNYTVPPLDQDQKDMMIKPTERNFRRHSALLIAAVTALSLAGLAIMISFEPTAYLGSRASKTQTAIVTFSNLIDDCELGYEGCHDPNQFLSQLTLADAARADLLLVSQAYNLNPRVLLTLYALNSQVEPESLNPTAAELEDIAWQLVNASKHNPRIVPRVYNHPTFGSYKLDNLNTASLTLLNFLGVNSASKEHFEASMAKPDEPNGSSFVEVYQSLE